MKPLRLVIGHYDQGPLYSPFPDEIVVEFFVTLTTVTESNEEIRGRFLSPSLVHSCVLFIQTTPLRCLFPSLGLSCGSFPFRTTGRDPRTPIHSLSSVTRFPLSSCLLVVGKHRSPGKSLSYLNKKSFLTNQPILSVHHTSGLEIFV